MVEIASIEPELIVAGDTVKWTKSLSEYLPSESWVLSYSLVKDGVLISFNASDNGDETHLVNLSAATTAAYASGVYKWQSYVTKAGERYSIESGTIEIESDYASAAGGLDDRSHAKIVLDALEATIQGKATKDQSSYSISFGDGGASRSISRLSFAELIDARRYYKSEYQRLLRKERREKGLPSRRTIKIKMDV